MRRAFETSLMAKLKCTLNGEQIENEVTADAMRLIGCILSNDCATSKKRLIEACSEFYSRTQTKPSPIRMVLGQNGFPDLPRLRKTATAVVKSYYGIA